MPGNAGRPAQLPYTAEYRTTRAQTLGDRSTITHEWTEVRARYSQGRTYSKTTFGYEPGEQGVHTSVRINDPIAKIHTSWFTQGQRVTVTSLQGLSAESCAAAPIAPMSHETAEERVQSVTGDLGIQTFLGVAAHGQKTTRTYPEGMIGNSAPLVHTDEWWYSTRPVLNGLAVRQVSDDPRAGSETRELVKFTEGEPDTALLQPPQDMDVVTQETHNEVRCP